jgi:hypothetical protein
MKVKDLFKKYKDYSIEVYGKPLNQKTIPYTHLPRDKRLEDCDVIEMVVEDKEHTIIGVSFKTMKPLKPTKYKGYVRVYVK